ncbi:hypothetical protein VCHENC02_4951B, partial [Vibrio harveyi]
IMRAGLATRTTV